MSKIFKKLTVVYILGILLLIIGIPYGIYGLTLGGGESLGGVLIFIGVFLVILLVIVDRILVRNVSSKNLNIYEIVFIIICGTIFLYKNRTLTIDNNNENAYFLVVIQNPGVLKNDHSSSIFPFSKKVVTNRDFIIVDNIYDNVDFNIPSKWNSSYFYKVYNFEKYPKVEVYAMPGCQKKLRINEIFLDSLISKN